RKLLPLRSDSMLGKDSKRLCLVSWDKLSKPNRKKPMDPMKDGSGTKRLFFRTWKHDEGATRQTLRERFSRGHRPEIYVSGGDKGSMTDLFSPCSITRASSIGSFPCGHTGASRFNFKC